MRSKILPMILLTILLLVSGVVRFYKLSDLMHFGGDQGKDAFIARDIATGRKFAATGPPTSVGNFDLGPAYYYLLAPFSLIFNHQPEAGGFAIAFFGTLSIFLLYLFARDVFQNSTTALLVATLYAFSAVVVSYQRFPWNPNLLPFFVLLFFFGVMRGIGEKRGSLANLILIGVGLGVATQLHFTAFLLFSILFLAFLLGRRNELTFYLASGRAGFFPLIFALVLFLHFPYLLYQIQHRFHAIKGLGKMVLLLLGRSQAVEGIAKTPYLTQIQENFFSILRFLAEVNLGLTNDPKLGFIFVIAYLSLGAWLIRRGELRKNLGFLIIFLWGSISLLAYLFYPGRLDAHYFTLVFPLPFLLWGVLLSSIQDKKLKAFLVCLLLLLLPLNLLKISRNLKTGIHLAENREVANFIFENKSNEPFLIEVFEHDRSLSPTGYSYLLSLRGLQLGEDFFEDPRLYNHQVSYIFMIIEPKQILQDPKLEGEMLAQIGHIRTILSETEFGNVRVVYAFRPKEIYTPPL